MEDESFVEPEKAVMTFSRFPGLKLVQEELSLAELLKLDNRVVRQVRVIQSPKETRMQWLSREDIRRVFEAFDWHEFNKIHELEQANVY